MMKHVFPVVLGLLLAFTGSVFGQPPAFRMQLGLGMILKEQVANAVSGVAVQSSSAWIAAGVLALLAVIVVVAWLLVPKPQSHTLIAGLNLLYQNPDTI